MSIGRATCLALDGEYFTKFFAKDKKIMKNRGILQESGVLDDLAVMSELSRLRRQKILESMELCLFEKGDYLCNQGVVERYFYIIMSGKVRITKNTILFHPRLVASSVLHCI